MEKGKGKEASQSDSNAEDDLKPNDTTLVLRNFFQQILLKDQSTPSQTNKDESYLNTAQVVEKLAHKEPALLYFYHKVFPNPDYEKVVTEMVAKVIHDANESAKSPRMKPRSYVPPPNVCRPRTSDLFDKTSTEDKDETEARKLVLLSNLKGILREAIVLNELQDESQARSESTRKMGVGRRVDVPYAPPLTSQTIETAGTVNGQKSQAARSSDPAVKEKTVATLPPPPSAVLGLKSDGSEQNCSQASSSKGKEVETTNEQDNHVLPTSSSNPVNGKVGKESFALSENVLGFIFKGDAPQASTSKGKTAEKVDEQKTQAAPKEKESVTPPPPPVVDFKFEFKESHQKHSTSTQASASKGKNGETTDEQNNRPTPIKKSNASVSAAEKAALSALVIDFISKADNQKYFAFGQTSTSNGKSTEKVNIQKEATPSSKSEPINTKVEKETAAPPTVTDPTSKGDEQKQSTSAQASTSNGKSSEKVKVEKDGFDLPPPPPPDEDLISKESGQKRATRSSTQASTQAASKPDPVKIKVEQEKAAPPPPPPASPPPVRCRPRMADTRQQEEIYVTSAHARERADKSRLRQAQDAHLRSGGRVVPKPEPVNSNPTQEEVKPKPTPTPTEKGKEKEKEEKKPEPIPTPASQSASGSKASSSKPETTAKPEPKPTENKSTKDTSSPKVSSGTQTDPSKEPKPTESFYAPREETRYHQYEYRPASSPPPKPRYEGQRGESASSNKYGRPLPARGASYTAQCSGITNEGRRCLIRVTTSFDGVSLEPYCQWHGEYYGSTKPKSLDPNKKERGRCSATTLKGTLCKRNADHYSSKSEYGYCWQHERMYGWNSVYS